MRTIRLVPVLPLLFAGCAGIAVAVEQDESVDLASYRTWSWIEATEGETGDAELDEATAQIRRTVDEELASKGLHQAPQPEAGLLVAHQLGVEQKVDFTDPYYTDEVAKRYEEETLTLDFLDAETSEVVWRGTSRTRVRGSDSPAERAQRIEAAVDAILARFPARSEE